MNPSTQHDLDHADREELEAAGAIFDRLTKQPAGCGCHLDPVPDDQPCDLCSEATGTNNGEGWKIVLCPLHSVAPELLEACRTALPALSAHEQTGCDCPDSEAARLLRAAIAKTE